MRPYYFGGYYLIKPKLFGFDPDNQILAHTCSSCINTAVFGSWCLSWTRHQNLTEEEQAELGLTEDTIRHIGAWTDERFSKGLLKWGHAFPDLETVTSFRDLFFPHLLNNIYSIYLPEIDARQLIDTFSSEPINKGDFGLRHNLLKGIEEPEPTTETFLGYDFIGVENYGDFHSFHCHGIEYELANKFSLFLNEYGLFQDVAESQAIRDYLNKDARVEPVPWFIAKIKRVQPTANQT